MNRVDLKPLSVNKAWQGRRYKTEEYKSYEKSVYALLPCSINIPPRGKLELYLEFGFSNSGSDWDNPIKPFIDILQKKYKFNDNRIYKATVVKRKIAKGDEYILFKLSGYTARI